MKIATFNINNVRKRLRNLLEWLRAAKPNVVCLQELKTTDAEYPADAIRRLGYEAAAKEIQDLYLDGKKAEATAAVPDELVDEVALCGPKSRIAELLEPWKQSPVTTLVCNALQPEALEVMAELVL